jgi:hypothetical protein
MIAPILPSIQKAYSNVKSQPAARAVRAEALVTFPVSPESCMMCRRPVSETSSMPAQNRLHLECSRR